MSMMRKCDGCDHPIPQRQFIEVGIRVLNSYEDDNQAAEQLYGDYCDGCIATGKAMENLVGGLTKYRGVEADDAVRQIRDAPPRAGATPQETDQ